MNERSKLIARLKADKKFRAAYIKAKIGVLVPAQIRGLRLKSTAPRMPRQKDLANEAEMHQSRISMFETPGAANVTLETLANIASALRTGMVVKFVPFSEMLKWENEFSQDAFNVTRLDNDVEFINPTVPVPFAAGRTSRPPLSAHALAGGQAQTSESMTMTKILGAGARQPQQQELATTPAWQMASRIA